jgi:hypothetical protein
MKKLVLILFIFLLSSKAFATAQIPDYLIYKGETFPLFSNPLESYFRNNSRPDNIFVYSCTACWRGYVATWKIENGSLHLVKLVEGTCSSDAKEIDVSIIFPKKKTPIEATWFSGTIKIPQGKELLYVHMGYGSIYEKEILLTIEKGKLMKEEVIDNTKRELPSWQERSLDELNKLKEWEETTKKKSQ